MPYPKFRTLGYSVWRACERLGIKPPNVKDSFDNCDLWTQSLIIGYNQLRSFEEQSLDNGK